MNNLKLLTLLAMTATLAACGGGGSASSPASAAIQPTATLTVDRTAVNHGESAMLSWNSIGAAACQATDGWTGSVAPSGTQSTGALTAGTTFSLTCTQGSLASPRTSVRVELVPTVALGASPATVASGGTAQLIWNSTDATACTAAGGWSGTLAASGSQSVGPFSATGSNSFTLVCAGPGGDSTAATTVINVTGGGSGVVPTASLTANPNSVANGGASTLTWSSTNATACAATGGWTGAKATSGTLSTGALTADTSYLLTCAGAGGTSSVASATVTVTAGVVPAPTASLNASPASITTGHTSTLTWSSTNATACTASGGWTGTKAPSGTVTTAALTATTIYSLTCTGAGGTSAAPNATVTVTTPAPTVTLTAAPASVTSGGTSTLTWSSTDAAACTASGDWTGTKATSGTATTAALTASATYLLSCTGAGGSGQDNATVTLVTGSLVPGTAALTVGQAQTFTKTLSGSATFSVDGVPGGNATTGIGTVTNAGVYVAGTQTGPHTILAVSTTDSSQSQGATVFVTDLAAVTTYHYDQARDGANTQEYALTTTTVNAASFGKLTSCTLDGTVVAQPLWAAGLTIGGARHNVVFVGTHHDGLYAIDADAAPCTILWHVNLADTLHGAGANEVPVPGDQVGAAYGDIMPEVGVASTPVMDLVNNILYVVSKSWVTNSTMYTRLHAIDLTSGAEKTNSPVTIAGSVAGTGAYGTTDTFDTSTQLQRAGLALVNNTVYVSFTAHEDAGTYFGWVFGYQYAGGTFTRTSLINVSPDRIGSGIWMSGGAPAADASDNLFLLTGNGHYDVNAGGRDYGDSLLKLSTPNLAVSQSWTPTDQGDDETYDNDFGAGGAAMLADLPNGSSYVHVLTCGGKSGVLEILNRDMLGGFMGATVQEIALGGPLFATAAIWNNHLYVAAGGQPLRHYNLDTSTVQFTSGTSTSIAFKRFGANPIVSASGTSNGIVWAMETDNYCTNQSTQNGVVHCGPVVLHAYDALNLNTQLWSSGAQAGDAAGYAVKFTSPLVANGHVYVGTRGNNVGGLVSSTSQPGTLEIYGLKP